MIARHVHLVEGGQHRGGVLRFLQPQRDGPAQAGHLHPLLARLILARRLRRRAPAAARRPGGSGTSSTSPLVMRPSLPVPAPMSPADDLVLLDQLRRGGQRRMRPARPARRTRHRTQRPRRRIDRRPAGWRRDAARAAARLRRRLGAAPRAGRHRPCPAPRRPRPRCLPARAIEDSTPADGALTSTVTLSVSSSTSGSSAATVSPCCLIQRATVAVVTLSPSAGTTISVATAICLQACTGRPDREDADAKAGAV